MPQRVEVLPTALLSSSHCTVCLSDGEDLLIHKRLPTEMRDVGIFVRNPLLLYVVQGSQRIHDRDGIGQTAVAAQLVYFPQGVYSVSDFGADDQVPFEALIFGFSQTLLQRQYHDARAALMPPAFKSGDVGAPACMVMNATDAVRAYMSALVDVYGDGLRADCVALAPIKLLELLHLVDTDLCLQPLSSALASQTSQSRIWDVARVMDAYWHYDLRIADYAALCGCSESTFTRRFKRLHQMAPQQWLVARRLQAAHALLQTGKTTVQDAALHAGYSNVSHFISSYKKQFQRTPKQTLLHRFVL